MQKKIVQDAGIKDNKHYTQYKIQTVCISVSLSKSMKYNIYYVMS